MKEGWDNPNVFVIAKLRSSGSETSKLQEVGRGLRLPVDEFGNRISDEQMYLRYIIDYSEKDFADKLKKEINGDDVLKRAIADILAKNIDGRSTVTTKIAKSKKVDADGSVDFEDIAGTSFTVKKVLPYSVFLREVQQRTNIPIKLMHSALCEHFATRAIPSEYFSKQTLQRFVDEYRLWFIAKFNERYSYEKIDVKVNDPLCDENGLKKSIIRNDVGVFTSDTAVLDNYLYDACCYDSQLEKDNITLDIKSQIAEVEVFGKIPKRTVRIPTYADGTYSPDFMYIVKKKDGSKQLNLIVETKDKENSELDPEEVRKITCAQKLFEEMQREVPNVRYRKQLKGEQMITIVESLFGE